jgi:hypothetical protein
VRQFLNNTKAAIVRPADDGGFFSAWLFEKKKGGRPGELVPLFPTRQPPQSLKSFINHYRFRPTRRALTLLGEK